MNYQHHDPYAPTPSPPYDPSALMSTIVNGQIQWYNHAQSLYTPPPIPVHQPTDRELQLNNQIILLSQSLKNTEALFKTKEDGLFKEIKQLKKDLDFHTGLYNDFESDFMEWEIANQKLKEINNSLLSSQSNLQKINDELVAENYQLKAEKIRDETTIKTLRSLTKNVRNMFEESSRKASIQQEELIRLTKANQQLREANEKLNESVMHEQDETSPSSTNVILEATVSFPPSSSAVAAPFSSQESYGLLEETSSVFVQHLPLTGTSPSVTNVISDANLPVEFKLLNQPSALVEETSMQQPSPIETPSSATTVIPDPNVSVTTNSSSSSVVSPVLPQQSEVVKQVTFDSSQIINATPSEKPAFKESPNITSVTYKGEMLHQQQFDGSFSSSLPQGGGWLEKSPFLIKDLRDAHRFFQKSVKSRWKFKPNSECERKNFELHTDPTTQVPRGSKLSKHHVDAIIFHYLFKQPMKAIIKDYREPSSRCLPPLLCCRSVRKSCNEFPVYPFSHKILPINLLGEQPGQIEPYKSSSVQPEKLVLIASLEGTSSSRGKWKAVN